MYTNVFSTTPPPAGTRPFVFPSFCRAHRSRVFSRKPERRMTRAAAPSKPLGEVLLLGLESAGKTLLCRHLENKCSSSTKGGGKKQKSKKDSASTLDAKTQPSIGTERLVLSHRGARFDVREIGGAMQQVWSKYYAGASAILFCC